MMQIEKQLSQTDLNQYKKDDLTLLIEQCYKYQKFKIKVAVERINSNFKPTTVRNYVMATKTYLKNNVKLPLMNSRAYEIIDNLVLTCYPILQPSKKDTERVYTKRKKHTSPTPVTPVTPVEPLKLTEPIPPQYGVKCENTIKLFDTKDRCLGYIDCYKEISDGSPVELVKIDFEVVNV